MIKRITSEHDWQQMKILLAELLAFENVLRPERKNTQDIIEGAFNYVRQNIAAHNGASFLACNENGEAVGFINAWVDCGDGLNQDTRIGTISDCYIRQDYRGRFIAQKLLQAMTEHFAAVNVRVLSAETLGTNIRMQKLFAHAGFKVHKMTFEKDLSRSIETAAEGQGLGKVMR